MRVAPLASSLPKKTSAQELVALLVHIPIALCGGILSYVIWRLILRFISILATLDIHRVPSFFTEIYSPMSWVANVLFGILVTRFVRSRSGPWVGVLGSCLVAMILVWDYSTLRTLPYFQSIPGGFWAYEWKQMFTSECSTSECLGLLFTVPCLALVSYGLGAWIGSIFNKTREQPIAGPQKSVPC